MTEDCRSDDGITTGLIDSLIFICRVLSPRLETRWDLIRYDPDLIHPTYNDLPNCIKDALEDLAGDEDVLNVLSWASEFRGFPSHLCDE